LKGRDADFSRKGAGPSDPSACETTSRKSGKVLITFGVMSETGIRYMAELEELIESYRAFAATVTLSAPADRATQRKLLKRTHKIIGPPPDTLAETRPELAQCEDLVTE